MRREQFKEMPKQNKQSEIGLYIAEKNPKDYIDFIGRELHFFHGRISDLLKSIIDHEKHNTNFLFNILSKTDKYTYIKFLADIIIYDNYINDLIENKHIINREYLAVAIKDHPMYDQKSNYFKALYPNSHNTAERQSLYGYKESVTADDISDSPEKNLESLKTLKSLQDSSGLSDSYIFFVNNKDNLENIPRQEVISHMNNLTGDQFYELELEDIEMFKPFISKFSSRKKKLYKLFRLASKI